MVLWLDCLSPREAQDSKSFASHPDDLFDQLTCPYNSGFKFLPVLGRYIADCFEGTATQEVKEKWKLPSPSHTREKINVNDGSRRGPPRRTLRKEEQLKARL